MKYHDLSAGTVTLNYEALLAVTRIAVRRSLDECDQRSTELRTHLAEIENFQKGDDWDKRHAIVRAPLSAEYLKHATHELDTAVETFAALTEMKYRPEVKLSKLPTIPLSVA